MGRAKAKANLVCLCLLLVTVAVARVDRLNESSEGELLAVNPSSTEDFDGGFSSLEGMLQWAIGLFSSILFSCIIIVNCQFSIHHWISISGHSDPAKLRQTAKDVSTSTSTSTSDDHLKKRQSELKDLINNLKMPSDAELMQITIDDLNNNSSLSLQDRHLALHQLLLLVEPIHNANCNYLLQHYSFVIIIIIFIIIKSFFWCWPDLNKLGGLAVVIHQLNHPDPETRTLAAWILGKSIQNNPSLQTQACCFTH